MFFNQAWLSAHRKRSQRASHVVTQKSLTDNKNIQLQLPVNLSAIIFYLTILTRATTGYSAAMVPCPSACWYRSEMENQPASGLINKELHGMAFSDFLKHFLGHALWKTALNPAKVTAGPVLQYRDVYIFLSFIGSHLQACKWFQQISALLHRSLPANDGKTHIRSHPWEPWLWGSLKWMWQIYNKWPQTGNLFPHLPSYVMWKEWNCKSLGQEEAECLKEREWKRKKKETTFYKRFPWKWPWSRENIKLHSML